MTLLELKNLISSNYPDNTTGLITPLKERQVLNALADFVVSSQGEVDTGLFVYDQNNSYSIGQLVVFENQWYISTINDNLGNTPGTGAQWEEVGAQNNVISIWETGIFLALLHLVLRNNQLYVLDRNVVGNEPFNSTDFVAELADNKWVSILGGGGGSSLPANIVAALEAATNPSALNAYITAQDLDNLDLPSGRRIISSEVIIQSDIAGLLTAEWINGAGATNVLTNDELVFLGTPAAGNFRWDLVELLDNGTKNVNSGTAGTSAVRPTPTADALIAEEIIWNDAGEATAAPGNNNQVATAWSGVRFSTQVAANTTNQFAKIWEGNLSKDNNYAIDILYNDPRSVTNFNGSGAGRLKVSWTCDPSRNIQSETVKFFTDADSVAGEFRLVQISGNKAAIYHKGSHFWSRIDFRVVFQSSAVRLQDFVNGGVYGAAPTALGTWDSVVNGGASGFQEATILESNTIPFDKNYIIGNAASRTGNILFDFTGAKLGSATYMRHIDPNAFSFPVESKLLFDILNLSTTDENLLRFTLTDSKIGFEIVEVELLLIGGLPTGGGGSSNFTGLLDTFSSYTGRANEVLQVNSSETLIESVGTEMLDLSSIVGKKIFTALEDTFASMVGRNNEVLSINSSATAIESKPVVELGITEVVGSVTQNAVLQITYAGNTYKINVEKV